MNYSVFKLQNQAGRPAIFWEKESVPKNDRKFGYKNNEQRFPVRRYPNDRHHIDNDLVSLSPDDPPPKPAKDFIKRNRQKVTVKKVEPPSTVTLTQEQLNTILKSVGKVASGSENAVKITVDKYNDTKEIIIESPRRHNAEEEYDDLRSIRRKKKPDRKQEDQGQSIYSFLDGKNKTKADSDIESNDSEGSIELRRFTRHNRHRKSRKSQRQEEEDDDDYVRGKNRRNRDYDIDNEDNSRDKRHRSRNRSNNLQDEIDNEIEDMRRRNKSKTKGEDYDSDYESRENRRRHTLLKHPESDNDDDLDRDFDRKKRTRKSDRSKHEDHSKERRRGKLSRSRERELDIHNESINKEDDDMTQTSPRDKIGLPMDLSWRHMTKAERRRLEMARQKLIDDEEKKEEDRIKGLNAVYDPSEVRKKPPQRYHPTRSDPPATRQTKYEDVRGRETEVSNHTDGNRRGRRSPSDQRSDRSPELPSYTTPDTSPKGPVTVSRHHMTLAEKKRLEWDRDRVESVQIERGGNSDPWGRPGAGAPLRTRSGHVMADYKGRQDQIRNEAIAEEESEQRPAEQDTRHMDKRRPPRGKSPPAAPSKPAGADQGIPITMRSSFVLGEAAPDYDRLTSAKERERKKWLADLEIQIEEKRQLKTKHPEVREENTWTDKFGQSYRAPFPEQPKETVMVDHLNTSGDDGVGLRSLESYDVQSAPDNIDNQSYIRGQNAPIDSVTKTELEEKRKIYLEHQTAVRAQVEEKERVKRLERERKMKEDMEEERKLQQERESLQKQFDMEQQKIKQKEQQRQAQVNQLKAAMDEAQAQALQDKYQRKMQHLEAGGHDTTKLREHLEGEITSRIELLHTRRERDVQFARHLLKLQHWGVETAEEEEPHNESLAQKPPPAKVTPRDHAGMTVVEPSHIPGLDLGTTRTQLPPQMPINQRDQSQGHYSHVPHQAHEPYMANRVLTPSQYRNMSKPWSDPGSPRREFGTQTSKVNDFTTDIDGDIPELLNPRLRRDHSEANIEYHYEKGKKVRVISAPREALERRSQKSKEPRPHPSYRDQPSPHEHHHNVRNKLEKEEDRRKKKLEVQRRKEPVELNSRPMWGYKNSHNKKPKKQSEKDPFFEQKKLVSDARRDRRERQLLAMVEANKPVIPDYYIPKSSRARSQGLSPYSDVEMASPREVRPCRRSKSHSPNRLVLQSDTDRSHLHGYGGDRQRYQSRSPTSRGRADLPAIHDRSVEHQPSMNRNVSPPVPALKHKTVANQNSDSRLRKGGKYGDVDPLDIPVQNGEFVPFTRTIDVLDPTKAEEPVPFSREATNVANARRTYYEGLHPEKFGNKQYVFQDKHRVLARVTDDGKDSLMNPSLLLDHPTSRQDEILVQLSTLKQSLMQRQRELETFSPSDLVRMDTDIRA